MHDAATHSAAQAAKATPGAHMIALISTNGGARGAEIVMLPDGTGYFMDGALPRLDSGHVYQLWAEVVSPTATRMVSVRSLGPDPSVVSFHFSGSVTSFEVTREEPPHGATPTMPVVIKGVVT
jgi:hypothetical protein